MKTNLWTCGFTRVELCITLLLCIAIGLIAILLVSHYGKTKSGRLCHESLRWVSSAYISYAVDNGAVVTEVSTNSGGTKELALNYKATSQHFTAFIRNSFSPEFLICSTDGRLSASDLSQVQNENISYFIATNEKPFENMQPIFGDRNFTEQPGAGIVFSSNATIHWNRFVGLHGSFGYLAFSDGHVEAFTNSPGGTNIGIPFASKLRISVP